MEIQGQQDAVVSELGPVPSPTQNWSSWRRAAYGLGLALAIGLQGLALERQSLTSDEPYHLLAGEQALRLGTNTINLEHPPLVKMVAAVPLSLGGSPFTLPVRVDEALARSQSIFDPGVNLERLRFQTGLAMLLCFALPFLLACFWLGSELGGARTGATLALLVGLSFAVVPYLSIVQTDTAVALGFTLTLAQGLRFLRRPGLWPAVLLGAFFGLALASKFSAVLLTPALLLVPVFAGGRAWSRAKCLVSLLIVAAVSAAVLLGSYAIANRHYDARAGREALQLYCEGRGTLVVEGRLAAQCEPILALERLCPSLAQWWLGLRGIATQNSLGTYASYAFGTISSRGRWWYFPAVLLIKTPWVILFATAAAGVLAVRRRAGRGEFLPAPAAEGAWGGRTRSLVLLVAAGTYLAAAVSSNYNLGFRHLLPIVPILYSPAARWLASAGRLRSVLMIGLALEALVLAPAWMSSTNLWWLGSHNPFRFALSMSDGEYKQGFFALARFAREQKLERLGVLLPGASAREVPAYVPGGYKVEPDSQLEPGWYAVSIAVEQALPALRHASPEELYDFEGLRSAAAAIEPVWLRIRRGEDRGYHAGTFHLYRLQDAELPPAPR